jgi:ATP-dependent helicase HepA
MASPTPNFLPGQRWVSDAEPELGLGTVLEADARSLSLVFEAADVERRYAVASAPLHRVSFAAGDKITDVDGIALRIDAVEELHGLFFYLCGERIVPEMELSPRMALGGPKERLLAGRFDPGEVFDLRLAALERLEHARRSPVRGLVGPRLELLPHQFYIASEVTSRRRPRVLLADETGLGKTIEACLILHRLLLTGRAQRALILVPDALVHQWLVELRRRFQLRAALFDQERCEAVEEGEPGANPFEGEQLVLAGWSLLVGDPERTRQAAEAGWDVVVVDEAHHLSGGGDDESPAYRAVAQVSALAKGLLLLTATPTQLGEEGHFDRLRLLDPERHADFETWKREAGAHREVARLGAALSSGDAVSTETIASLASLFELEPSEIENRCSEADSRVRLLAELTDRHGPGRVIFRNTRAVLSDLPERQVSLTPLAAPPHWDPDPAELRGDDPRIEHLAGLLRDSPTEKILVICREAETTRIIKERLEERLRADIALFNEELSLVQRDRNAAFFVEPGGARMLICSEIGSEGRNFQHARHLVMFDLPLDPDLVEQRIGRVDRIGQHGDVLIDVPYVTGSRQEVLARWHQEGVGTFGRPIATAQALLERFGSRVRSFAARWEAEGGAESLRPDLQALLDETFTVTNELEEQVESGRDRLLEMSSLRREVADGLIEEVLNHDDDAQIDEFFLALLEHFQVVAKEVGPRTFRFDQEHLAAVNFGALSRGDVTFTFDRETALVREDFELASMDHPLMLDAIELLLDSESGKAAFVIRERPGAPLLLLEAIFVLEVIAPPSLHVDRFLPPTCIRVVVDQTSNDRTADANDLGELTEGDSPWFREKQGELRGILKKMLQQAETFATRRGEEQQATAARKASAGLSAEIERLTALARANDRVRPEEISLIEDELEELRVHLASARLRLDSLRLVWCGPAEGGVPLLG